MRTRIQTATCRFFQTLPSEIRQRIGTIKTGTFTTVLWHNFCEFHLVERFLKICLCFSKLIGEAEVVTYRQMADRVRKGFWVLPLVSANITATSGLQVNETDAQFFAVAILTSF
jgi:hypothetical protein